MMEESYYSEYMCEAGKANMYERWFEEEAYKVNQLQQLLLECLPVITAEVSTWQARGGKESYERGERLVNRVRQAIQGK